MLTNLTEVRPLIRTKLNVKIPHGRQLTFGLVDCAVKLDFVS
jgi:hypothetical protein